MVHKKRAPGTEEEEVRTWLKGGALVQKKRALNSEEATLLREKAPTWLRGGTLGSERNRALGTEEARTWFRESEPLAQRRRVLGPEEANLEEARPWLREEASTWLRGGNERNPEETHTPEE